jgi:hypothetical protein
VNNVGGTKSKPNTDLADYMFRLGSAGTSSTTKPMYGMVGEVLWYDHVLSEDEFTYQRDRLQRKWQESRAFYPLDAGEVVANGGITLEWDNLLPDTQGDDVYVDVYFGTDPNRLTMTKLVDDGMNQTTASTAALGSITAGTTYYWAVDTRFGREPNTIEGPFYSFVGVADPAPAAIWFTSAPWATWPNEKVTFDVAVTDEGSSNVTVSFSADDPNVIFYDASDVVLYPAEVVIPAGGGTVTVKASVDYDVIDDFTVTATAVDGSNPGEPIITDPGQLVTVYGNACQAARIGMGLQPATDIMPNCVIDLADFAALAAEWLDDYSAPAAFQP